MASEDRARDPLRLVVGVGASAGGLEAFKRLLAALPEESDMAFLFVQHLDPSHESMLAELLAPQTRMRVEEADQGVELAANTVYVIRPGTALAIRRGKIEVSAPTLHRGVRLPVDHLFRSLAREYGPHAAGIVLSGAGSDGSAGLREIKAAGGLTVAQDPDTCQQYGMPRSAIDTGVVDLVLPIREMPAALERFSDLPERTRRHPSAEPEDTREEESIASADRPSGLDEGQMARLAAVLEAQLNFDLRVYKSATIERRVLRRMALSGFETVESYVDHLRKEPAEQRTLVRDLLINVTDFFRDPGAFQALEERVIEPLVVHSQAGDILRVWVAGCATGEEAYSIGMLFLDLIASHEKRATVQIFATDVDEEALAFARAATYPPSIAQHVSEERLRDYFEPLDDKGYRVRSMLRDVVSFASHDLTKDPPFSRMDLVSCRNVLIYLTSEAQKHVLGLLHFALSPQGHLFLSTSETPGPRKELFSTLSKSQRLYKKVGTSRPVAVSRSWNRPQPERDAAGRGLVRAAGSTRASGHDLARRTVLHAWVPPTVVVSADGDVLFAHGELGPYLRFPQGEDPKLELGPLLRPTIATRARGALYKCRRNRETVIALSSLASEKKGERVRITAKPAPDLGDDAVMLSFETIDARDTEEKIAVGSAPENAAQEALIEQLENELQATREDLHTTVEELETSNEELRSSNEESMSMNEELQSANEELEATTEELRSLNEELTTVNSQLRAKVELLEEAHDDLNNFFASTKIATIFLDERLCIKRFTPAARELLEIDHADVDRFVGNIARELLQNDLAAEAKQVLEHFSSKIRELRTSDDLWIEREILPYRTESRQIAGVVVTFTDVTELRSANAALEEKSRRLELAWDAARGGIYEHRVPLDESSHFSDQWARILGYRPEELPPWNEFLAWLSEQIHPDDLERFESTYADFIDGRSERFQVEVRLQHRGGHWIWVRAISKPLERDSEKRVRHLLGMMIDITDLKRVEEALRESETRFREMTDGLPLIVWVHGPSGEQEYVNTTYCEFFGVDREEMKGGRWQMLVHPADAEPYHQEFFTALRDQRPFHAEARVKHADGSLRWIESWARPRRTRSGEFRGMIGTSADITERKLMEEALGESEQRLQIAKRAAGLGVHDYDIEHSHIRWDERVRELWGVAPDEEITFETFMEGLHPDDREPTQAAIDRAFDPKGEGRYEAEYRVLHRHDGQTRWVFATGTVRFENGEPVRLVGTVEDITAAKRAREALQESREQLREADRQKDEFLAMLGHELRNPLAAIRSASELLGATQSDDSRLERTHAVLERQTRHMAKLIDGLLDISRIIRGKIELEVGLVDFVEICRDVASDVANRIPDRSLELRTALPPEPIWVKGDPVRLAQIVDNLLSNAVKYTGDGGRVTLTLERDDRTAVLSVLDTGIGIEADLLPQIFDVFLQSQQSLDRSYGGLGLGLALVKYLADLHGGDVRAESEGEGQGSEFVLRLPISPEAPPTSSGRGEVENEGPSHLLVIEDNEDAAEMLRDVLELSGHEVRVARLGRIGVEMARERRPDAVLCDLGLPEEMSGFDVARALRADPDLRDVPLVAVSGYARPEDKKRGVEAGFDAHLAKPIDVASLEKILAKIAETRNSQNGDS